jgi:hypothetical protein
MKKNILASLLAISALAGCGKDQDVEDYNNAQLAKDTAKVEAAQGTRTGKLISMRDGSNLGGMEIVFKAGVQVQQQTNGNKASAVPVLRANIILQNGSQMEIDSTDTYYNNDSGEFSMQIPVQEPSTTTTSSTTNTSATSTSSSSQGTSNSTSLNGGSSVATGAAPVVTPLTATIYVQGHINGDIVTGTIYEGSHPQFGGRFTLSKNGGDINSLAVGATSSTLDFTQLSFSGTTTFENSKAAVKPTRPATLIIAIPESNPQQKFLNVLDPQKAVLLTLNYGSAVHLPLANAQFDQSLGKLTGQLSVFSGTQTVTLNTDCNRQSDGGYICTHTSNTQSTEVAKTVLNVVSAASAQPSEDPNDSLREPIFHTYHGSGEGFPGSTGHQITSIDMTVVYPSKDRADEILNLFLPESYAEISNMQISLLLDPNSEAAVPVALSGAKWDVNGRELDAQQSLTTIQSTLTLSCQNFSFSSASYDFTCLYIGSTFLRPVEIHFAGNLTAADSSATTAAQPAPPSNPVAKPRPKHKRQ